MTDQPETNAYVPQVRAAEIGNRMASLGAELHTLTMQAKGFLRCECCGIRRTPLPSYWRYGWPKHCGQMMRWWTERQIQAGEVPALTAPSLTPDGDGS